MALSTANVAVEVRPTLLQTGENSRMVTLDHEQTVQLTLCATSDFFFGGTAALELRRSIAGFTESVPVYSITLSPSSSTKEACKHAGVWLGQGVSGVVLPGNYFLRVGGTALIGSARGLMEFSPSVQPLPVPPVIPGEPGQPPPTDQSGTDEPPDRRSPSLLLPVVFLASGFYLIQRYRPKGAGK
ncbi:MAG: hypothetical protein Q8R28_09120 [Dehalococcoidia bacterium]|nr:hypothetical protein [Dehalococcoidia bacterium]